MKHIVQRLCIQVLSLLVVATALLSQQKLEHKVLPSETVYSISRRYGVTVEEIYSLNEGSQLGIREGQTLLIPTHKSDTLYINNPTQVLSDVGVHTVQDGETLYSISRQYGLTMSKILELNPDKVNAQIEIGERIIVASGASPNSITNPLDGSQVDLVRVQLILPITKSGQPSRYIYFYEGALLAIEELQRQGVSIDLHVDVAEDYVAIQKLTRDSNTKKYDLIVGGDSEQSVELLSRLASDQQAVYLSPFVWQSGQGQLYDQFFQLNPAQYRITQRLLDAFTQRYADCEVLLVRCDEADQEDKFKAIERACQKAGITLHSRSLRELTIGQWPTQRSKKIVLLLNSSRQKPLIALLNAMSESHISMNEYQLFGYPQWQTYGKEMTEHLRRVGATIFSTFYWDKQLPESQRLDETYRQWYGRYMEESFPSYALLGYDVMRYFVAALSTYGKGFEAYQHQLPTDGLQSGFLFAPAVIGQKDRIGGYTNVNLFFVTYSTRGDLREQIPLSL